MIKQDPRDYLLIGRVVLKKQRPLTEAEIKHKQREALLEKLNYEIKVLQMQAGYERKVNTVVRGLKGLSQTKYIQGPMKIAANEYRNRMN
jgi:hypothetical protein